MRLLRFLRRIPRIPHRLCWEARIHLLPLPIVVKLWLLNKCRWRQITHPDGPAVSLTTHGKRIRTVYSVIESIADGELLPSRLILWLDDVNVFHHLPASLRHLQKRGLEITLCENYGPHTKYYPYIAAEQNFRIPLVTADDDILYPRNWLKHLMESFLEQPDVIHCYRAHVVGLEDGRIAPYTAWKSCTSIPPSFRHFATGVSGVLYPPAFLEKLKQAGEGFKNCCPKADDVWLHVQAVRGGFPICQVGEKSMHFLIIPGTQKVALAKINGGDGGNDQQIAATYTTEDIQLMLTDQPGTST